MTEYETADLRESKRAVFLQQLTIIQSLGAHLQSLNQTGRALLFGYVMVAYFIGAELTGVQAVILSVFFVAWVIIIVAEGRMVIASAVRMYEEAIESALEINVDPGTQWDSYVKYASPFSAIFTLILTVAALYFMWSVRHP